MLSCPVFIWRKLLVFHASIWIWGFGKTGSIRDCNVWSPYNAFGWRIFDALSALKNVCLLCDCTGYDVAGAKAGSPSGAVLGIGFIGIGEYLLCLLLPSVSYMDVLKYVNLAQYIKVYPLLSQYHNLDVFGYPVNAMHIFWRFCQYACCCFWLSTSENFPLRQSKGAMEKEEAEERTCICDG